MSVSFCHMLELWGYRPFATDILAGTQSGLVVKQWLNRVPWAARVSMWGVRITGWPAHPRQSALHWSGKRKRMCGLSLLISRTMLPTCHGQCNGGRNGLDASFPVWYVYLWIPAGKTAYSDPFSYEQHCIIFTTALFPNTVRLVVRRTRKIHVITNPSHE